MDQTTETSRVSRSASPIPLIKKKTDNESITDFPHIKLSVIIFNQKQTVPLISIFIDDVNRLLSNGFDGTMGVRESVTLCDALK